MNDMLHDSANAQLLSVIPAEQLERILDQFAGDIDYEFLGFVGIYKMLADIIPTHWTVVDLGCAYAPQAFFFTSHKKYIGVNLGPIEDRFAAANTEHHSTSIEEFCAGPAGALDQNTTFAICSYVPPWGGDNMKITRDSFKNVFTYYPAGGTVNIHNRGEP